MPVVDIAATPPSKFPAARAGTIPIIAMSGRLCQGMCRNAWPGRHESASRCIRMLCWDDRFV